MNARDKFKQGVVVRYPNKEARTPTAPEDGISELPWMEPRKIIKSETVCRKRASSRMDGDDPVDTKVFVQQLLSENDVISQTTCTPHKKLIFPESSMKIGIEDLTCPSQIGCSKTPKKPRVPRNSIESALKQLHKKHDMMFGNGRQDSKARNRIGMPLTQQTPWSTMLHPNFQPMQSAMEKTNQKNTKSANIKDNTTGSQPRNLSSESVFVPGRQMSYSILHPSECGPNRQRTPNIISQRARREVSDQTRERFPEQNVASPLSHRSEEMLYGLDQFSPVIGSLDGRRSETYPAKNGSFASGSETRDDHHNWQQASSAEQSSRNHHWQQASLAEQSSRDHHWQQASLAEQSSRDHHWQQASLAEQSSRDHHWQQASLAEQSSRDHHWQQALLEQSSRDHHWQQASLEHSSAESTKLFQQQHQLMPGCPLFNRPLQHQIPPDDQSWTQFSSKFERARKRPSEARSPQYAKRYYRRGVSEDEESKPTSLWSLIGESPHQNSADIPMEKHMATYMKPVQTPKKQTILNSSSFFQVSPLFTSTPVKNSGLDIEVPMDESPAYKHAMGKHSFHTQAADKGDARKDNDILTESCFITPRASSTPNSPNNTLSPDKCENNINNVLAESCFITPRNASIPKFCSLTNTLTPNTCAKGSTKEETDMSTCCNETSNTTQSDDDGEHESTTADTTMDCITPCKITSRQITEFFQIVETKAKTPPPAASSRLQGKKTPSFTPYLSPIEETSADIGHCAHEKIIEAKISFVEEE